MTHARAQLCVRTNRYILGVIQPIDKRSHDEHIHLLFPELLRCVRIVCESSSVSSFSSDQHNYRWQPTYTGKNEITNPTNTSAHLSLTHEPTPAVISLS